jgi:hypothetical protein
VSVVVTTREIPQKSSSDDERRITGVLARAVGLGVKVWPIDSITLSI